MLLADGPSPKSMLKSPIFECMERGSVARFEEITRVPSEVQDALISIMSEKAIAIPELGAQVAARRGFNIIATANTRDKGVNDMSAALKRRFNIVVLPSPSDIETESEIVRKRVREIARSYRLASAPPSDEAVRKVVTVFRELRRGATLDDKIKVKQPANAVSTAEAISLLTNAMALAQGFGDGNMRDADIAAGLQGAIVKDEEKDSTIWKEYLENVMKKRGMKWHGLYEECSALNG
jgi:MoxR-like ATPase